MEKTNTKLSALPWRWILEGHPDRIEPWLNRAHKLGLDGVEVLDGWLNDNHTVMWELPGTVRDLREKCLCPQHVRRVKKMLQAEGLQVSLFTVHNDFYCYTKNQRQAERDRMKLVLEIAAEFDCDFVRITSGRLENEKKEPDELFSIVVDMINQLLEDAAQQPQKLVMENHPGLTRDPAMFLKIIQAIDHPKFGINFDVKHVDGSALAAARQVVDSGRLFSVHIDNYIGQWPDWQRNVTLEKGDLDIAELVNILAQGQPCWWSNEFAGEDIDFVDRNISYLRSLLKL